MNSDSRSNLVKCITDIVYLITFAVFLHYRFLGTTMHEIHWADNYYYDIQEKMWWIIGVIFFVDLLNSKANLKSKLMYVAAVLIMVFVFVKCYNQVDNYDYLLELLCLSIGAARIDYRKILRVYLLVVVPITILTIIQSQTGKVTNLVYYRYGHIRESFGFIYPTDFAAHIFFIICVWIVLRGMRIHLAELFVMGLIAITLQVCCEAKCGVVSILGVSLLTGIIRFNLWPNIVRPNRYQYRFKIRYFVYMMPVLCASAILLLGRMNQANGLVRFFDNLTTGRIHLTHEAFEKYSIQPWGQYVYMKGNGGSVEKVKNYFYLDSSYVNIIFRYGYVLFALILVITIVVMKRKSDDKIFLAVLFMICAHSLIEHHLIEHYYNIFILLPFARFDEKKIRLKPTYQIKQV